MRLLLVDDNHSIRSTIRSILDANKELEIVAEAITGLEAIRSAEIHQPDLILLDIGLPDINGIEAARRIAEIAPSSEILFLSQHSSPDIVNGALNAGGIGYVVKSDAFSELLPAIAAAASGATYLSERVRKDNASQSS